MTMDASHEDITNQGPSKPKDDSTIPQNTTESTQKKENSQKAKVKNETKPKSLATETGESNSTQQVPLQTQTANKNNAWSFGGIGGIGNIGYSFQSLQSSISSITQTINETAQTVNTNFHKLDLDLNKLNTKINAKKNELIEKAKKINLDDIQQFINLDSLQEQQDGDRNLVNNDKDKGNNFVSQDQDVRVPTQKQGILDNLLNLNLSGNLLAARSKGFNFDINFVTKRILCMDYPLNDGNRGRNISQYLNYKYKENYLVVNMSEKSYDKRMFIGEVFDYSFPGYSCCPLDLMFKICVEIENFLNVDETNVVIVHCLSSKSRSVILLSCLLAWAEFNVKVSSNEVNSDLNASLKGEYAKSNDNEVTKKYVLFGTPLEALRYVSKTCNFQLKMLMPSQVRYLRYFDSIINLKDGENIKEKMNFEAVYLSQVKVLNGVVNLMSDDDFNNYNLIGCRPYLQLYKHGTLLFSSIDADQQRKHGTRIYINQKSEDKNEALPDQDQLAHKLAVELVKDNDLVYEEVNTLLDGDILLRLRHIDSFSGKTVNMFRYIFNTAFAKGSRSVAPSTISNDKDSAENSSDLPVDDATFVVTVMEKELDSVNDSYKVSRKRQESALSEPNATVQTQGNPEIIRDQDSKVTLELVFKTEAAITSEVSEGHKNTLKFENELITRKNKKFWNEIARRQSRKKELLENKTLLISQATAAKERLKTEHSHVAKPFAQEDAQAQNKVSGNTEKFSILEVENNDKSKPSKMKTKDDITSKNELSILQETTDFAEELKLLSFTSQGEKGVEGFDFDTTEIEDDEGLNSNIGGDQDLNVDDLDLLERELGLTNFETGNDIVEDGQKEAVDVNDLDELMSLKDNGEQM